MYDFHTIYHATMSISLPSLLWNPAPCASLFLLCSRREVFFQNKTSHVSLVLGEFRSCNLVLPKSANFALLAEEWKLFDVHLGARTNRALCRDFSEQFLGDQVVLCIYLFSVLDTSYIHGGWLQFLILFVLYFSPQCIHVPLKVQGIAIACTEHAQKRSYQKPYCLNLALTHYSIILVMSNGRETVWISGGVYTTQI